MSQVYHHPKIGDIRLLPNTRCRGIRYSISSKGALISFNPLFADRVLPLPADKEEWFLRHKERIGRQANKYMYDANSRLQTSAFEAQRQFVGNVVDVGNVEHSLSIGFLLRTS